MVRPDPESSCIDFPILKLEVKGSAVFFRKALDDPS